MGGAADQTLDTFDPDYEAMIAKGHRPCDVCDGVGAELDEDGSPVECYLCEGAGWFDKDGFPADDESEKD